MRLGTLNTRSHRWILHLTGTPWRPLFGLQVRYNVRPRLWSGPFPGRVLFEASLGFAALCLERERDSERDREALQCARGKLRCLQVGLVDVLLDRPSPYPHGKLPVW